MFYCVYTEVPALSVSLVTQVTGKSKKQLQLPRNLVQRMFLPCRCHVASSNVFQWSRAKIGGKDFTAGEKLISGRRCGSVVTSTISGRSMYGLVKQFLRVVCVCLRFHDFAVLTWFPRPTYPDSDPLTVRVGLDGVTNVNTMNAVDVISLNDIEPSRVAVDLDPRHNCMLMLRLEGTDTM